MGNEMDAQKIHNYSAETKTDPIADSAILTTLIKWF